MKTHKSIITIIVVLLMFVTTNVLAIVEPNYEIEKMYVNSAMDILGSMHVTEVIIVKGSLNEFERTINYSNGLTDEWKPGKINFKDSSFYNASGYSLSKVSSFKLKENEIDWKLFTKKYKKYKKVSKADLGQSGVYTSKKFKTGEKVRIYNENKSGYVAYVYDYYINQVAVLHKDVAEINWNFIPKEFNKINDLEIQLTVPALSTDKTFRFWGHGALSGEIAGISEKKNDKGENLYNGVLAKVKNLKEGNGFNIRMTFDKNSVSMAAPILKNSEQVALNKIIEIETSLANKSNKNRLLIKIMYYSTLGLSILYIMGLIIIWIYIYIKYDKEHKINFDGKYYREFTGDYNVEVIDYLFNKDITTKAFSASIMNLIYKKNIQIIENAKDKRNIKLKYVNNEGCNSSEILLMDLLFKEISNKDIVSLKQIEKYSKSGATAEAFMCSYNNWKNDVISRAEKENFFEEKSTPNTIAIIYLTLAIILFLIALCVHNSEAIKILIVGLIGSISFLLYTINFKKHTIVGREHYLKWNGFKNFLNDFGNLKDKDIPEITLWEKYLVYATLFGIAAKVKKNMKVSLNSLEQKSSISTKFLNNDYYFGEVIDSSIERAYFNSNKTINMINAENTSSPNSSGSGFRGKTTSGGGESGHGF